MINIARHYLNSGTDGKRDVMDYYNALCAALVPRERRYYIRPGDDWCAAFVSVVAHKAGIRDGFPFEVSTYYQVARLRNAGRFFEDSGEAMDNDLAFFDWNGSGTPNHVGIVVATDGGMLETIEGNKGDKVAFRRVSLGDRAILGYGRVPSGVDAEDVETIDYMARCVIRGQYGSGQRRREALGRDYEAVQARVNELLAAKRNG